MSTTLMILGGILAFALGIWLGLPGRYTQTAEDIEERMAQGPGRRKGVKRHFTPIAWLQRQISVRSSGRGRRSGGSRGFRMELPDDR